MNHLHNTTDTVTLTLTEETVAFGGMILEYRLLVSDTSAGRFRIRISKSDERSEFVIGNDIDVAMRIYHAVVRGRVTPCALQDVLGDLCG